MTAYNYLTREKTHLATANGEGKWIPCEHGVQLPPQQFLVPVAVRTLTGYYTSTGFWQSTEFTDEYIEKFLSQQPNQVELERFLRLYLASVLWCTAGFKKLVGVMAWYNVPTYNGNGDS